MIDLKELVQSGLHFGHQKSRWCPKMKPYIWGQRGRIHLIDVSKTARLLEDAAKFVETIAGEGKSILWVGTKKVAQGPILEAAQKLEMPYVTHRWIGGTITNFSQVKKSVTKLLHFEDILERADDLHYTKKELGHYKKLVDRLKNNVGGISKLSSSVGAIVLVDVGRESTVLREANQCGVPVIALVDTNHDPSNVDYVIPGNDDSPKSVKLVVGHLADAAERGYKKAKAEKDKKLEAKKIADELAKPDKAAKKVAAKPVAKSSKPEAKKVATKTASTAEAKKSVVTKKVTDKPVADKVEKKVVAKAKTETKDVAKTSSASKEKSEDKKASK